LKKGRSPAKTLLELIHTNVWEPIKTPSFGGAKYYVFFTNNYPHKSFIYILKSPCLSKFQEFKAFVERQIGEKIKILKSDNKCEFKS
jgi:hypothetical protein